MRERESEKSETVHSSDLEIKRKREKVGERERKKER